MAIKGITVDSTGCSEIIEFSAALDSTQAGCKDRLRTQYFDAGPDMEQSLRDARQVVSGQLGAFGYLFRGVMVPLAAHAPSLGVQVAIAAALAACVVFSVAGPLLAWLDLGPVRPIGPKPLGFLLAAAILLALLLRPFWHRRRLRPRLRRRVRDAQELASSLRSWCLVVGTAPIPGDGWPRFDGRSAGLAFYCAIVDAVASVGPIRQPWAGELKSLQDRLLASVNLSQNGHFEKVDELPAKVQAVLDYASADPRPVDLVVFALADGGLVREEWQRVTAKVRPGGEQLEQLGWSRATRNCDAFKSQHFDFTFLFCSHIDDFVYYLHPWKWRWLALRGALVSLVLVFGAFALQAPRAPAFQISCWPELYYRMADVQSTHLEDEQLAGCFVRLEESGFPGPVDVEVRAAPPCDCLAPVADAAIPGDRLRLRTWQDQVAFTFSMPDAPHRAPAAAASNQAVVVRVANRAGIPTSRSIIFIEGDE